MVRLVFRRYTQIRRTICTSVSLRASTRVSPGFTLFRHRSPSFGSQQICSYSNLSQANDRSIVPLLRRKDSYLSRKKRPLLSLRIRVLHPNTCIYVRLLGPCFKTGEWKPFRQHREPSNWCTCRSIHLFHRQNFVLSRGRANRRQGTVPKGGLFFLRQDQRRACRLNRPEAPTYKLSPTIPNGCWLSTTWVRTGVNRTQTCSGMTGFQSFPVNNFKYFLTLFSKFFSSFPHGTCSLSVSRKYLALDEIYHPLCASSPRSTTLGIYTVRREAPCNRRDSHPLWCPVPRRLMHGSHVLVVYL